MEKTELYETFQKGLTSVNGESYIAADCIIKLNT